ncbi:phage tail tip fiber protein [Aeromonas sp. QDB30]|uniref:phage tail tip fiber protein n=1 Tax=Aeromonas sp. QDB30 TaxID=2989831 RepID=UPI0022E7C91A|nr:DUF1983 domain-containing protein [Aeromonas sp. QDB30]
MAKKPAYRAGRDQAATAENVELLTGQRGDRLDKAVTFRELEALGLSTLHPGAGGVYVPGKNPELFPPGQMEFPHAPVNVIANGAFHTVLVEWDQPRYRGHAHAEIWRAESNNQSDATLVGTSSANLFSDAIGKGATFYYWVRFVNGKDDRGPFQGMQGIVAETSRDVQDILDELQGKIEKSHLVQSLLNTIEDVPQLQLDVSILKPKVDEIEVIRPKVDAIEGKIPSIEQDIAILKPKVDEIEVIRPKVAAIEGKIPGIEQELAGLDERQKVAQELLDDAQQQLGMSSIEIGLAQDRLNAKIDKYKGDFDSFRDAVFVVDPETGSITMDAVNAVRDELHTSIAEVQQDLDAVAGQITSKADNVTVDSQGRRITEAEQRINGLDASLSQTVTRGEFTGEQQRVTQIGQELDATKGELTQKATKQEVDAQGVRLANAESKLTVHTDELSSQAQRIDGLQATVSSSSEELDAKITELARVTADANGVAAQRIDGLQATISSSDEELNAKITELARVTADADGVAAQRVSGLEVRASEAEGKILALEEVIESEGGITAGRFDEIQVEIELAKDKAEGAADVGQAAIDAALAGDERDRENRSAFGTIRTQQQVIVDEQSAQAKRITDMNVKFEGRDANTQARISGVEEVIANAGSALAQRIDDLSASTDTALDETTATIKALEKVSSDADAALALSQDQMRVEMTEADNSLSADIASESEARLTADEAISRRMSEVEAQFSSDLEDAKARVAAEELARATKDEALAQQISTVDAAFKAADTALSASLSESSKALADADRALGERISTLDVTVGENSASITELRQAVVNNEESLSQRQDKMESEIGIGAISQVEGALAGDERDRENRKARGVILQQQSTLANQQEAQARTIEQLTAEVDAETADLKAQITNEQLTRATADEALSQRISTVDAAFKAADAALSASLSESSKALADADRALGERISTLDVTVGENSASITELRQAVVNNEESLSQRQDKLESEVDIGAASLVEGALTGDERDRENRKARGTILQQQSTLANQQEAQARTIEQLTAEFDAETADLKAQITNEQLVRATADEALSQRISVVDAEFKAANADTNAAVAAEVRARSDADSALAEQLSTLDAEFKGAEQALAASIDEVSRVSAEANQSLSEQLSQVKATAESAGTAAAGAQSSANKAKEDAAAAAGIAKGKGKVIIQPVAPGASDQLAQNLWIDTSNGTNTPKRWSGSAWVAVTDKVAIDAAQAAAAAQASADQAAQGVARNTAAINNEAKARADADSAMAKQIQQVTANYQQGDQQLAGQITAESVARANAVQSLGSQINTVSAVAGSKNKTFFQATAPSTGMGTGDLWFDTDSNNRPYRYSGTAWIATDDPRIAANAAAVQLQSQAIADLQNGAQAMWTAKASAGQITAGIGLIAKSDGTSQVVVSASQFFVFNPNSPSTTAPLFAIDNGQAVIAEAIIRKATIQILNAEKITADYVKAGVSISSPLINGGQIDMGNAFMSGGAAGFGKGGPYGGWGWGWYTIIYADGSIYTNRLRAEGGYVKNMTMNNCTIEQDCVVKGTVYADRIVGDVAAIKSLYMQQPSGPFSMFFNVAAANFTRGVIVTGINIKAEGYDYGGGSGPPSKGTSTCTAVFYMNGVEFGRESVSATGDSRKDSATASATVTLPAGVRGRFQVSILGNVSVSLVGAVAMVFKHGSATFE